MARHPIDWRGIFPIALTPFTDDDRVDEAALRKQIDFCVACGVQGIVTPGVSSEFYALSDAERERIVAVSVEATAGRVPLVAGVSGTSPHHAKALARAAQAAGADALMAMPPYADPGPFARTRATFEAVAEAGLPIVLQNADKPFGRALAVAEIVALVEALPLIQVVKEETTPGPQKVAQLVAALGSRVRGVMGGQGGVAFFNEMAAGAVGTMPASQFSDLYVQLWAHHTAGREPEARALFRDMLPALMMELSYGIPFKKECLRRRGVQPNARVRVGQPALEPRDQAELDALWPGLAAHFRYLAP